VEVLPRLSTMTLSTETTKGLAVVATNRLLAAAALTFGAITTLVPVASAWAAKRPAHREVGTFIPALAHPEEAPLTTIGNLTVEGSINWSGYVQSGNTGTFTGVESSWVVPTVSTSPAGFQYSSDWVGIGGFSDETLIQAGTLGLNADGTALYFAWTEILPASLVLLPMGVRPGDSVTAVVREVSGGTWLIRLTDKTTGVTQSRTVSYNSSGKSVEVIQEAPTLCMPNCVIETLATTTNVTFEPSFYTSTLGPVPRPLLVPAILSRNVTDTGTTFNYAKLYELEMESETGATIATPSAPNSIDNGFTVADGAIAPSPPST